MGEDGVSGDRRKLGGEGRWKWGGGKSGQGIMQTGRVFCQWRTVAFLM